MPQPTQAGVAQLVRASACHAEGRGFEPRHSRHLPWFYEKGRSQRPLSFLWLAGYQLPSACWAADSTPTSGFAAQYSPIAFPSAAMSSRSMVVLPAWPLK